MKTQTPPSSFSAARALRVGLICDGALVAERVIPAGAPVTIGSGARNTLCIADPAAPRSHVLFAPRGGGFALRWSAAMSGRVATGEAAADLAAGGGALVLDPESRGKIALGKWTVLFQHVPAPVAPARAPARMQGLFLEDGDPVFLGFLGGFSSLAALLIAVVIRTPIPTTLDVAAVAPRDVELLRSLPLPPAPKVITKIIKAVAPKISAHPPAAPSITHTGPPPAPLSPEELEAKVMAQSKMLALLATHGDTERPDVFSATDAGLTLLDDSLAQTQVAEKGSGSHLHSAQGGRVPDQGIGEIGHNGGGESHIGRGPSGALHLPGRSDIEPVGGNPTQNDAVRAQVVKYAKGVQACYEQALRLTPSLEGRMVLDLHVQMGRVTSVDVAQNLTGDEDLASCAVRRARDWHFDPSVTLDLSVPFSLSGS